MSRWITAAPEPEPVVVEAPEPEDDITPTGPMTPTPGVGAPEKQLPVNTRSGSLEPGHHWYLGVHGGAGETTIASLDAYGHAADHQWPAPGTKHTVVLVARETVPNLLDLQAAIQHFASGAFPGITVTGAVTIAAAPGKTDRAVKRLLEHLEVGTGHLWRVEWHHAFHLVADPQDAGTPGGLRKTLRNIHRVSTSIEGETP